MSKPTFLLLKSPGGHPVDNVYVNLDNVVYIYENPDGSLVLRVDAFGTERTYTLTKKRSAQLWQQLQTRDI